MTDIPTFDPVGEPAADQLPEGGADPAETGAPREVALGRTAEIDPSRPVAGFSTSFAEVYEGRLLRTGERALAYVSSAHAIVRVERLSRLAGFHTDALLRPVEWGPVQWVDETWRYAVIYAKPNGGPVFPLPADAIKPLSVDQLKTKIIRPLVDVLMKCREDGVGIAGIRPSNFYFTAPDRSGIALGDVLVGPPGAAQPNFVEPVEFALADPLGRGEGGSERDIFNLGMTVACFAAGHIPYRGYSDEEILEERMYEGSYRSLTRSLRLPTSLRELVRGMLDDDPQARITLDALSKWTEGSPARDLQRRAGAFYLKATEQPIIVSGKPCRATRGIAAALYRSWTEAAQEVDSLDLPIWASHHLRNNKLSETLQARLQPGRARHAGTAHRDARLSRIIAALDPMGPLRFRGISAMLDGLGHMLAARFDDERFLTDFRDLLRENAFDGYLDLGETPPMVASATSRLGHIAKYSVKREFGAGIEYALYAMNPQAPCASPILGGRFHVVRPEDLIDALNEVTKSNPDITRIVDRHVAAFIAARVEGCPPEDLRMTEYADSAGRRAVLRVLALTQRRAGVVRAEHLAKWLAGFARSVVADIRHVKTKEYLAAQVDTAAQGGNLAKLTEVLDNAGVRRADLAGYRRARSEAAAARAELARLDAGRSTVARDLRWAGQRAAGQIATTLGIAATAGLVVLRLL